MAKKVKLVKEEKAKITGSADTKPHRGENAQMQKLPAFPTGEMARSIGARSSFDDQKKVNTLYRWRGRIEKI
jgi:hypothetical protein